MSLFIRELVGDTNLIERANTPTATPVIRSGGTYVVTDDSCPVVT